MSSPLVSVSVTCYQHGPYIRRCLDGVIMQETSFPLEVLIGEDGSTDGTRDVCIEFAERYPERVQLYLHDRSDVIYINGRATGRSNFLHNMKNARGRYVALCEGDDYWTDPRKLQKQVEILESRPDVAGVFHDCWSRNEAGGEEKRRIGNRVIDGEPGMASIIAEKNIPTASMVFRRFDFLVDPPDWFFRALQADYAIALMVARRGIWKYLDEAMSVYRRHQGGMWSGTRLALRIEENVKFWTLVLHDADYEPWRATILAKRRQEYLRLACALAGEGRFAAGFVAFSRGLGPRESLGHARLSWRKLMRQLLRPYLTPAS